MTLCSKADRHPVPAIWFRMDDLNHVLIVLNSSLNFYIYCVVGKRFRTELYLSSDLFAEKSDAIAQVKDIQFELQIHFIFMVKLF